jgi:hypothetical protein
MIMEMAKFPGRPGTTKSPRLKSGCIVKRKISLRLR